jgi:hypothetical protein
MTPKTDFLLRIHPGMEVYDAKDHKVGTVKYVRLPDSILTDVDATDLEDSALRQIIAAWNSCADVPAEARGGLLQDGFVKLNLGPLRGERYILPEHISSIAPNQVRLRVERDDLP